jgi:hypothetical protein
LLALQRAGGWGGWEWLRRCCCVTEQAEKVSQHFPVAECVEKFILQSMYLHNYSCHHSSSSSVHGPHYGEEVKAYDSAHRFHECETRRASATTSHVLLFPVSHFPSLSCRKLESQHKHSGSAFQPPKAPTNTTALGITKFMKFKLYLPETNEMFEGKGESKP